MLDRLFFVILVLNATGLFAFLAPQLGVDIGTVSLSLLGLHGLYLAARWKCFLVLLRPKKMKFWMFLLLVWPLLTVLYAPVLEIRDVGLQLYFVSLLCGAIIYTTARGLPAIGRVMRISLVVTLLGLVLSMIAPQYFEAVCDLADENILKQGGRACGFLLQPNALAMSMNFLFIGWYALWRPKNVLHECIVSVAFLLVMLVTGSRTGILIALTVVVFILVPSWKTRLANPKFLAKIAVGIACLAGGILATRYYLSGMDYVGFSAQDLIDRIDAMSSFRFSDEGGIRDDISVQARLGAQEVYWGLIKGKPLLGHGLGSDAWYMKKGPIYLSSHSEALTCALKYGALYPLGFVLLMLHLQLRRRRSTTALAFRATSVSQFVCVTLILFFINGGMFDSRTFPVVCGMFFAAVYFPLNVPGRSRRAWATLGVQDGNAAYFDGSSGLRQAPEAPLPTERELAQGRRTYI